LIIAGAAVTVDDDGTVTGTRMLVPGSFFTFPSIFDPGSVGMYEPNSISAQAEDTHVCEMDAQTYTNLDDVITTAVRRATIEMIVKVTAILSDLSNTARTALVAAMTPVIFTEGEPIIVQGEMGERFYVILSGNCRIMRKPDGKEGEDGDETAKELFIRDMGSGEYFGEMALLRSEPRSASVYASSRSVVLASIDRDSFELHIGSLRELLEEAGDKRMRMMGDEIKTRVTMFDLKLLQTVGVGRFGQVKVVVHKPTGVVYALKSLTKSKIIQSHLLSRASTRGRSCFRASTRSCRSW